MLDFIKLSIKDIRLIQYFRNHNLLTWLSNEDKFNRYDPEVINTKEKYIYKGIVFCFYSNELKISFLPHYFFNDNLHNANDFSIVDCIKVLLTFKDTFNVDLKSMNVINLEFGINVISPICIKDLITFIAYHTQNEFRTDPEYQFSKKSYRTDRIGKPNIYKMIKAYAKGIQFPEFCHKNTFRFEIKCCRAKFPKSLGIFTLNDLLDLNIYSILGDVIIKEFNQVLILNDNIETSNLTNKEVVTLNKLLNPNHWYRIKQTNKRNAFNDEIIRFTQLVNKSRNLLKKQLQNLVIEKIENLKKDAISTLYNTEIRINNNCICRVTGTNISMQKDNSILLSHSGLKHYHKNDPKIFEQVKRRYLSDKWKTANFELQIKELAHNIRNNHNNGKLKQERIYKPGQLNLLSEFQQTGT